MKTVKTRISLKEGMRKKNGADPETAKKGPRKAIKGKNDAQIRKYGKELLKHEGLSGKAGGQCRG